MGTACSVEKRNSAVGSSEKLGYSSKEHLNAQNGVSPSIVCSTIWNPFPILQEEAEKLLQEAHPGAFIFSHDITSEIFLSMSTGKYVCHHPILKHSQRYLIGGRNFNNIEEAVSFYRKNPLGDSVLTDQFYSNYEGSAHRKHSYGLSTPKTSKSKHKHVTFETPQTVEETDSMNNHPRIITTETVQKTTETLMDDESSSEQRQEQFCKVANKPRKSICRIQPEDSLSTSSGNMFKEEEF